MNPVFEYSEVGEPLVPKAVYGQRIALSLCIAYPILVLWLWGFTEVFFFILALSLFFFLVSRRVSIVPVLSIKAYSEGILIDNVSGSRVMQRWVINASEIGRIRFLEESPLKEVGFDNPYRHARHGRKLRDMRRFRHVIAVRSHSSAILVESESEDWLIGLDHARSVFGEFRKMYIEHGLYNLDHSGKEQAMIEVKRVPKRQFNQYHLGMFSEILYPHALLVTTCAFAWGGKSIGYISSLACFFGGLVVMNGWELQTAGEMGVHRIHKDRIEIRERKGRRRFTTVMADQIRDIGTIHVEFGNYLNIPEYTEAFRVTPYSGLHDAVTIVTDTRKWALDLPHAQEAAAALRELYNLDPQEEPAAT